MFKILVLDDNSDILEAVSFVLKRKKMEVVTIQDASELEPALRSYHPDLLLMDIALGNDFDGRDLCMRVKKKSDLPVVLFTAQHYTRDSVNNCGADAIMEKPFKLQELYETITRFCLGR